jgi:integral membrane sensor domain MASE1
MRTLTEPDAGRLPGALDFLAVGILYFLAAKAGVHLTVMPEGMAILWPANSVLLAALLVHRGRGVVGFGAAVLVGEFGADLPVFRAHEALLFGLINIGEGVLAWALLARWRFRPSLPALRDCVQFVVAGPLTASFLAACAGGLVYSLNRGAETSYLEFLRIWWFGDAVGLMVFTPLLIGFHFSTLRVHRTSVSYGDAWVSLAGAAAIGLLVTSRDGQWLGMHVGPMVLLPLVIYVAARSSMWWSAVAVAGTAVVLMALLAAGRQPLGDLPPRTAVIRAQEFLFIASLLALGLNALMRQLRSDQDELEAGNATLRIRTLELEQANRALRSAEAELLAFTAGLEQTVQDRTAALRDALAQVKRLRGMLSMCAWCKRIRDDSDWRPVDTYIRRHTDAEITHSLCPDCYTKARSDGGF